MSLFKDGVPPEFLIDAHLSNLSNSGWVTLGGADQARRAEHLDRAGEGFLLRQTLLHLTPAKEPHAAVWMWNVGVRLPHAPSAGSQQARRA